MTLGSKGSPGAPRFCCEEVYPLRRVWVPHPERAAKGGIILDDAAQSEEAPDHREPHFITFSCYRQRPLLSPTDRRKLFLRARESARKQELFARQVIHYPFWQKRYYDFNLRIAKKRIEKLRYMHHNPVKEGLCTAPGEWKWSSHRTYAFAERGIVLLTQWRKLSSTHDDPTLRVAQDGAPGRSKTVSGLQRRRGAPAFDAPISLAFQSQHVKQSMRKKMADLDAALQQFEATESNLEKLEKLWTQIETHIGDGGPAFGSPPEYDELCLAFRQILPALPAIDGFRVEDKLHDYDSIGQMRLDALEVGEIEAKVSVENLIEEQGRLLREYRFKLQAKRRELIRDRMLTLIDEVDELLRNLGPAVEGQEINEYVRNLSQAGWTSLEEAVAEIHTLLGGGERPARWGDLHRHLSFGMVGDLSDIQKLDWPAVKAGLRSTLYGQHDPVPVAATDLGEIVAARPRGRVPTKLNWSVLSDEDFERLMFLLITGVKGYENPEWLQHTHAPDRGRDLSVTKVETDPLAGVRRYRVIIQCKHWLSRSIGPTDVGDARSQMELWQPPRVDQLIIATTGRFTVDAIALIEQHNQADRALHISMWPDSHLETLLAARPHLIGQFSLKRIG